MTFGQFWARMEAVTRRLGEAGVASGATVAVVLPEGPHFLSTLIAVSRTSACAPINPALTAAEMETYLTDLAPDALLVAPEFTVAAEVGRRLGLTVIAAKEETEVWSVVAEGGRAGRRYDAAVILQTSATTGKGKLVGLSRENLNASAAGSKRALGLTERDRVLLLSPLFHLQGLISAMAQLALGGSAIATSGFDREKFTWWLQRLRPTWYTCGPTMHRAICSLLEGNASVPEGGGSALNSLRFVRSIGAPLSAELTGRVMKVLGVPVLNGYGMTETGVVTSMPIDLAATRTDSVGKTIGTEIRIANAEGCDVSPGEEGEIVLRGPNVMAGYLNDVEGNRRSYWDGWFRTGDLGRLDAEDFLYITGRLKEQINRAGEKIHPGEVDDVMLSHPAIQEAATFAVAHASLGEDVACAVVLRPSCAVTEAELQQFVAERLAPFKVPRRIYFVEKIPRGSTGKPRRHLLAEWVLQGVVQPSTGDGDRVERPLNEIERKVMALWSELLGRHDLRVGEDFFSAGGDSMGAVSMLNEVEQMMGIRAVLSSESFFYEPTVAHLAEMVGELMEWEKSESPSQKIIVIPVRDGVAGAQTDGERGPLFLFPPDKNDGTNFRRLATALGRDRKISIVRPGHMRHRATATVIEDAARESAAAVRLACPEGPYVLAGYCFGGAIAFETARLLEKDGCSVALILIDTPAPGYPQFWWKPQFVAQHWRLLRAVLSELGEPGRARFYAILSVRKVTWNAILLLRPLYAKVLDRKMVKWVASRAKMYDLTFFRLHRTRVPVLHLIARERTNRISRESYFAWTQVAESGVTVHDFPGDHDTIWAETNLAGMAEAIQAWLLKLEGR